MTPRRLVGVLAEIALIALTIAVTIGLERLFLDTSFLDDLIVLVIASHGLAIVARRAGFGMAVAATVSAAGMLVVGNILLFPETAGSIIPSGETLSLLRADLTGAWTIFSDDSAPVEPVRGFVVASGFALWWSAFLADWAAFRLRSSLETIAPATTMFVFAALLGAEQNQIVHGAAFAAAVGGVLLTMRADRQTREEVWVASGTGQGVSTTLRIGTMVAALAVVFGALAGPAVPGAGEALIDPSTWDDGAQTRSVISPLVEINASLVEQSNFEMFSVRVDDPEADKNYWRLMALTDFNGQLWKRKSNFQDVRGDVGTDVADNVTRRTVRQEITTSSLGGIYLPAAYEVDSLVDSDGVDLEYETATGALVITRESEARAAAGFTYVLESAVPEYSPASLPASATAGLDTSFLEEHTRLPASCSSDDAVEGQCWPDKVTELAEAITAGATTDYERVLALQNHFLRPSNFTYDLDVALRHDVNDIEDFLFIVQRGYCEQFASTFASMARSIGIPARVAVGFTWGDWNEERGEYVVRGEHAHAWPEVYFADVGWVVFDPTPGRAPAHGSEITGLAPAQLNENDARNHGDESIAPPPSTLVPGTPGELNIPGFDEELAPATTVPVPSESSNRAGSALGVLFRAAVVFAVISSLIGSVPVLRHLLRRRRLHRVVADPVGRTELAWDDAAEALAHHSIVQVHNETLPEFTDRVKRTGIRVGPLDELAREVALLRYSLPADAVPHAIAAQIAAAEVVRSCRASRSFTESFVDAVDPRTLRFS